MDEVKWPTGLTVKESTFASDGDGYHFVCLKFDDGSSLVIEQDGRAGKSKTKTKTKTKVNAKSAQLKERLGLITPRAH